MADNVAITPGSGATIATDDAGAGGHVQIIKLAISTDGSATLIPAEATNGLDVDVTRVQGNVAVTGTFWQATQPVSGTFWQATQPVSGTVTANAGTGTRTVAGDVASDTSDSGNPVKVGAKGVSALPTAVTTGDRVDLTADLFGRLLTAQIDPAQQVTKSYNDTSSRAAASAQNVWDPTSGKKIAVTSLTISTYGTTAGRIFLFFADDADLTYSAGTDQPLFVGSFAPSATSKPGVVLNYTVPVFCTTANRRLHYQNDAAISVDITVVGYEW
jgi:hypothetical protein